MKYLIIDERMRKVEKDLLESLGYKLISINKSNIVYEEISSHVDIFTCKVGENVIIEKSKFENIRAKLPEEFKSIREGAEFVGESYPDDIKYNVCTIANLAIHNFKFTDTAVKQNLIKNNFELINVKQGYTNCSIAVIDEHSAITSDKGLYKALISKKIDTLFLDYIPNIKLYSNGEYSNKNGFIGGAISRIGGNIVVFGDLGKIDREHKIRDFIKRRNLNIIDFEDLDVIDYGGIMELDIYITWHLGI